MITEFGTIAHGSTLRADLCLIGAGAAGISLAREFVGSTHDVLLLESGGMEHEADTQDLCVGENVGIFNSGLDLGRLRYFGGTTNHWSGRCTTLDPLDMAPRPWVPNSGWPLAREELEPYYRRALPLCQLGPDMSAGPVLAKLGIEPPPLLPRHLRLQVWQYSPPTRFGSTYAETLRRAGNIRVLLHANAVALASDGATVRHVAVRDLDGRAAQVRAAVYVLCCGALENARLLLNSVSADGAALGNRVDLVGRFFMEHARCPTGVLVSDSATIQTIYNAQLCADGSRYHLGLAPAADAQREAGMLNCSGVFAFQGAPDSGVTAGRDIWLGLQQGRWVDDLGAKVWRVIKDLDRVLGTLRNRIASGRPATLPLRLAVLSTDMEQAPRRDSRVTLSDQRDALGLRRLRLDWRIGELERRTARFFTRTVMGEFARLGLGRGRLQPALAAPLDDFTAGLDATAHHTGTTRMATTPTDGVVDPSCRVHGIDNLYVCGGSVFPTCGHANPTLTIVALALRLADNLKRRLA